MHHLPIVVRVDPRVVFEGGQRGDLGPKIFCTKNHPTKISLLQILLFPTVVTSVWEAVRGGGGVHRGVPPFLLQCTAIPMFPWRTLPQMCMSCYLPRDIRDGHPSCGPAVPSLLPSGTGPPSSCLSSFSALSYARCGIGIQA